MKYKHFFQCLFFLVVFAFASGHDACARSKHSFEIKDGSFVYDGKEIFIHSGEMHYSRIPHPYWRHRLQMMKALGLNTVATYVFWNLHEPEIGRWDFSGDKNLREYIRIAGEEGMHVILRPGPYACAEWEFGGYPWWLQNVDGLELRKDNEHFLKYTRLYIDRLYEEVGDLQVTKGGPIIMVQVENEFGSYAAQRKDIPLEEHRSYNRKIKEQLSDAGFDVPFFTSDGSWLFEGGSIEGVLPTANGENNIDNLKKTVNQYHDGKGPYMVAEFYTGWLAHWAEPHPQVEASAIARKTEEFLQQGVSFNYYMVHGGTNFGFVSGANYDKNHDIQPDLTSYDYDAPISEAGWRTVKFDSLRNVMQKYSSKKLPGVPEKMPVITLPPVKLTGKLNLFSLINTLTPVQNNRPLSFEELKQPYGYVLYSKKFNQPISGRLEMEGLRDFAVVFIDGEKVGTLNRGDKEYSLDVDIPFNSNLQILVENMGRINYGPEIVNNKKGIISPVKINGIDMEGNWEMTGLPMDACPDLSLYAKKGEIVKDVPMIYEGSFSLDTVGDTFLNMEGWGKGIVFINGKNLGRYWNVGPQQTLYLPGVWLKKGENKLTVFEQLNPEVKEELNALDHPVLMKLNK